MIVNTNMIVICSRSGNLFENIAISFMYPPTILSLSTVLVSSIRWHLNNWQLIDHKTMLLPLVVSISMHITSSPSSFFQKKPSDWPLCESLCGIRHGCIICTMCCIIQPSAMIATSKVLSVVILIIWYSKQVSGWIKQLLLLLLFSQLFNMCMYMDW